MLRYWFPMTNGTSENQGLSNPIIANTSISAYASGKLGKCCSFNGTDSRILWEDSAIGDILKKDFTICFWVYDTKGAARSCYFSTYNLTGSITAAFSIEKLASKALRYYWAASPDWQPVYTVPDNTWVHIVAVHKGNNMYAYINGEEINKSETGTWTADKIGALQKAALGRDYRTSSPALSGYMNDFRLYDTALSPREIKEISKGLVLHYPLNREGFGADNLLYVHDHNIFHQTNNASTYPINRQWLFENGIEYERITRTNIETNPTVFSIYGYVHKNALDSSITAGMEVTVSVWVRCSHNLNNAYLTFLEVGKTSIKGAVTPIKANQWTKLSLTATLQKSYSDHSNTSRVVDISVYGISIPSGEISNFYFDFRQDYKMELGTLSTPWTPNQSDSSYSAMGLDDTTVFDTSGYKYNGTVVDGGISYSSDTVRYNVSAEFDGVNSAIAIPWSTFYKQGDVFTLNLWWKKSSLGSKNYETLFGGSGIEMDTRAGGASTLSLYMTSTRGGNLYTPFSFNEWYMNTLVNDGTNELYYVNGQLVKTIEKKNMPTGTCYIGAWTSHTSQNYKGLISDFRIYKTALSADDILELYQVGTSLANNGVLMAHEIVES